MDFHGDPYLVHFVIAEYYFKNKDAILHETKSAE